VETKQIRLGSVSLLCTFVLVCVAVLTVLSMATVRADWQLTENSAQVTTQWYELQNEGQRWLAQVDAALRKDGWDSANLPEGSQRPGERVSTTLTQGGRTLSIALERSPEGSQKLWRIVQWQGSTQWDEEETLQLYTKGEKP
jgi:hypothetical protein